MIDYHGRHSHGGDHNHAGRSGKTSNKDQQGHQNIAVSDRDLQNIRISLLQRYPGMNPEQGYWNDKDINNDHI
ncbi:MAG: hypothetical protein PHI97_30040 [Desulfobulbus sp.]|nr:hypothetical protein [Desulfobulbus sp.]